MNILYSPRLALVAESTNDRSPFDRLIEALTDPKTWMFFLFAIVANLQNGISVQYSLIIQSFGFSTWQTTLLSIPSGAAVSMVRPLCVRVYR